MTTSLYPCETRTWEPARDEVVACGRPARLVEMPNGRAYWLCEEHETQWREHVDEEA